MRILAISEDRSIVDGLVQQGADTLLWEVDYDSGEPLRRRKIPNPSELSVLYSLGDTQIDQGDHFRISTTDIDDAKDIALLVRLDADTSS